MAQSQRDRLPTARTELYWKWCGNPSDPFIGGHLTEKTKQNHRLEICYFEKFGLVVFTRSKYKQILSIVLSGHKHGEKLSFWETDPPGLQPLDAKTMVMPYFLRDFHNFEYALTAEILYTVP